MSYILGIDTGGTFTDGALVDPKTRKVCSTAKSFTTKEDLSVGIRNCLLKLPGEQLSQTAMVCLSTTLATNAIVEKQQSPIGLFLLGRQPKGSLPAKYCVHLQGELDIKGRQRSGINREEVQKKAENLRGRITAAAISSFASVRNPAHEIQVKEIICETLQIPVVCAHELSQTLGFYDRTVTAALNAGLITCITALMKDVKKVLAEAALEKVPLMIVKGDGTLMKWEYAMSRPVETILSGPAASVAGAQFLTEIKDGVAVDMGGTTTDIACIRDGTVQLTECGALVGGWRPQIRAVNVSSYGIGGDSRLNADKDGKLSVGPQRVIPLCVAGEYDQNLSGELRRYRDRMEKEMDGEECVQCYRAPLKQRPDDLAETEQKILELLENEIHTLFWLQEQTGIREIKEEIFPLIQKGLVQKCGLTPTDLLHASGQVSLWDGETAKTGAEIMAERLGQSVSAFLQHGMEKIQKKLLAACQETMQKEQNPKTIQKTVIGLGAPVGAWMPKVCRQLFAKLLIPPYAEAANAIGAAAGSVSAEEKALIRPDQYHEKMVVHASWGVCSFDSLKQAQRYAVDRSLEYARKKAERAGGHKVTTTHRIKEIWLEQPGSDEKTFIETQVYAVAVGSPRWHGN